MGVGQRVGGDRQFEAGDGQYELGNRAARTSVTERWVAGDSDLAGGKQFTSGTWVTGGTHRWWTRRAGRARIAAGLRSPEGRPRARSGNCAWAGSRSGTCSPAAPPTRRAASGSPLPVSHIRPSCPSAGRRPRTPGCHGPSTTGRAGRHSSGSSNPTDCSSYSRRAPASSSSARWGRAPSWGTSTRAAPPSRRRSATRSSSEGSPIRRAAKPSTRGKFQIALRPRSASSPRRRRGATRCTPRWPPGARRGIGSLPGQW